MGRGNKKRKQFLSAYNNCCAVPHHDDVSESTLHTYELDGSDVSEQVVKAVNRPMTSQYIHFRPHATAGGGDCGIHALCGEKAQGEYYCDRPRQLLLRSFDGCYDEVDARIRTAAPEGGFWPDVQRYIWLDLFVDIVNGNIENIEGRLFLQVLQKTQPEVYAQAHAFLNEEVGRRQRQDDLWEDMKKSARGLFRQEVWKSVVQHALVLLDQLPWVLCLVSFLLQSFLD